MDCLLYNNAENRTVKRIQNKWWLLLHKDEVVSFQVSYPKFNPDAEVLLEAELTSGLAFLAYFTKKEELVEWLKGCEKWGSLPISWYKGEGQRLGYTTVHKSLTDRKIVRQICKSEVALIPSSNPQETTVCKLAI